MLQFFVWLNILNIQKRKEKPVKNVTGRDDASVGKLANWSCNLFFSIENRSVRMLVLYSRIFGCQEMTRVLRVSFGLWECLCQSTNLYNFNMNRSSNCIGSFCTRPALSAVQTHCIIRSAFRDFSLAFKPHSSLTVKAYIFQHEKEVLFFLNSSPKPLSCLLSCKLKRGNTPVDWQLCSDTARGIKDIVIIICVKSGDD